MDKPVDTNYSNVDLGTTGSELPLSYPPQSVALDIESKEASAIPTQSGFPTSTVTVSGSELDGSKVVVDPYYDNKKGVFYSARVCL